MAGNRVPERRADNHFNPEQREALKETVYKLRLEGLNYGQIGRQVGVTQTTVKRLIDEMTDALRTFRRDEKMLELEVGRIDKLIFHASELLSHPHPEIRLKANTRVQSLSESRRKLLGLDEAERVEHTIKLEAEEELSGVLDEWKKRNKEQEKRLKHAASRSDPDLVPDEAE